MVLRVYGQNNNGCSEIICRRQDHLTQRLDIAVTRLTRIQEMLGSNLGRGIICSD
jgi:hypothetical protein